MIRLNGLILAVAVAVAMSACASAGGTGAGAPTAAKGNYPPGTAPWDNDYTKQANRAIGIAMLRQDEGEKRAQYETALRAAEASIAQEPDNPRGWFLAGQAYAGLNEMVAADSVFKKAQEIYPAYEPEINAEREEAWLRVYNEGIVALQANDIDGAIRMMELADAIYQGRPEAKLNLGAFYANRNEVDKAIVAYQGALEILRRPVPEGIDSATLAMWQENEQPAAFNLAQLLTFSERYDEAEAAYREFRERYPDNLDVEVGLADVLVRKGDLEAANELYDALLSRTDLGYREYMRIGVGLFEGEVYDRAAEAFRQALKLNTSDRDAAYNLAQSLYVYAGKLDEQKKAQGADTKAIDAKLIEVHTELVAAAQHVVDLDPANQNILAYLARSYQALSQLSADRAKQNEYRNKVAEVLDRHEKATVEMANITVYPDEGQVRVVGTLRNLKVKAGTPIRIEFTMMSMNGTPVGTADVTVDAPAAEGMVPFEVVVPTSGEMGGWKYSISH